MKTKTIAVVFFVFCCYMSFCAGRKLGKRTIFRGKDSDNVMEVTDFSIFYDLQTNETITKMMPRPWYTPGWLLRLPFTGGRCNCEGLQCSCCTGIRIQAFNFDRRTCAILTYEPTESLIEMTVMMNNDTIFRNTYSARNPPPFCVPVPVPYLPPGLVDMCIRLFDINVVEQKLHVCMDIDARVDRAPVLVLHFDCMDMGLSGVSLSKPGSSNVNINPDIGTEATTEPTQLDFDVFDPVNEKSNTTTHTPFTNTVKYI